MRAGFDIDPFPPPGLVHPDDFFVEGDIVDMIMSTFVNEKVGGSVGTTGDKVETESGQSSVQVAFSLQ